MAIEDTRASAIAAAQQFLTGDKLADRLADIDARARLAGWEPPPVDPRTPEQKAFDRVASLPSYNEGEYRKAGIDDPAVVAFAQAAHMQPGGAAMLASFVKTSGRPAGHYLSSYISGAKNLTEAGERRAAHEKEAGDALRAIGGSYAAMLSTKLDQLPRGTLNLLIRTVQLKGEITKRRPQ